jgi:hypothetical protein
VAVGVGVGVSVGVGVAVGVAASVALGEGLGVAPVGPVLGKAADVALTLLTLRLVATAARMIVVSPVFVAGLAIGSRCRDGLTLTCGVGVSSTATGDAGGVMEWLTTECLAPKYTIVNRITSTIRARLAATSVGANIVLIESHRPFLRMAPVPPCEPSLAGPFYPMAGAAGLKASGPARRWPWPPAPPPGAPPAPGRVSS